MVFKIFDLSLDFFFRFEFWISEFCLSVENEERKKTKSEWGSPSRANEQRGVITEWPILNLPDYPTMPESASQPRKNPTSRSRSPQEWDKNSTVKKFPSKLYGLKSYETWSIPHLDYSIESSSWSRSSSLILVVDRFARFERPERPTNVWNLVNPDQQTDNYFRISLFSIVEFLCRKVQIGQKNRSII